MSAARQMDPYGSPEFAADEEAARLRDEAQAQIEADRDAQRRDDDCATQDADERSAVEAMLFDVAKVRGEK